MSEFSIRPLQSQVSIFYKTNTNTNTSILIRHITSTLMFDRSKLPSLFNIKLNRSYRKMEVKIISFWLTERFQFFCKKLSQDNTDLFKNYIFALCLMSIVQIFLSTLFWKRYKNLDNFILVKWNVWNVAWNAFEYVFKHCFIKQTLK